MAEKGYIKCLYIFIAITFAVSILYVTSLESVFAQKNDKEDEDKLIVKANINLKNVDLLDKILDFRNILGNPI